MDKDPSYNKLDDEDLQIILDFEEEQFRLGNFEKIFPCINNVDYFGSFIEYPRATNALLARYLHTIDQKHNLHHICFTPLEKVDKLDKTK